MSCEHSLLRAECGGKPVLSRASQRVLSGAPGIGRVLEVPAEGVRVTVPPLLQLKPHCGQNFPN